MRWPRRCSPTPTTWPRFQPGSCSPATRAAPPDETCSARWPELGLIFVRPDRRDEARQHGNPGLIRQHIEAITNTGQERALGVVALDTAVRTRPAGPSGAASARTIGPRVTTSCVSGPRTPALTQRRTSRSALRHARAARGVPYPRRGRPAAVPPPAHGSASRNEPLPCAGHHILGRRDPCWSREDFTDLGRRLSGVGRTPCSRRQVTDRIFCWAIRLWASCSVATAGGEPGSARRALSVSSQTLITPTTPTAIR